jgi:hypothetical protein
MIHVVSNALEIERPWSESYYVKTEQLPSGTTADILQLTFNAVGLSSKINTSSMSLKKILNKAIGRTIKF